MTEKNSQLRKNIFERAKDLEIDFFYSSKGHYRSAALWDAISLWLGIFIVSLSTTSGFLSSNRDQNSNIFGLGTATAVAFFRS